MGGASAGEAEASADSVVVAGAEKCVNMAGVADAEDSVDIPVAAGCEGLSWFRR